MKRNSLDWSEDWSREFVKTGWDAIHKRLIDHYRLSNMSTTLPSTLPGIEFTINLYGIIRRLTADFVSFTYCLAHFRFPALSTPDNSRYRMVPESVKKVTREERHQLLVAFLRYELCCRLYGIPDMTSKPSLSDERPLEDFIYNLYDNSENRLCVEQSEEVACIAKYV